MTIADAGPAAVPRILERLSPDSADCPPLLLALGEIGAPEACPRLEHLACDFSAETEVGVYARKALALCCSGLTSELASEALDSRQMETVELGFWMVVHGHCTDLHPEVARAALRLAGERSLNGTAFLEASAAARESATEQSWADLSEACQLLLAGEHSVWVYRPMIESGLAGACRLLLQLVVRLWREHRSVVNGIFYAIWALAEEPVSASQVGEVEHWRQDTDGLDDLYAALHAMSAEGGFGAPLRVAARLQLPNLPQIVSDLLHNNGNFWYALELAKTVPLPSLVGELASLARPGERGLGCAITSAEALAAQDSPEALVALAEALHSWDWLPEELGYHFADRAVASQCVEQCRAWLADLGQSKCLRQAAAIAVGLALYESPERKDTQENIAALEAALAERGDVGNAAAIACGVAGRSEFLESLRTTALDDEGLAFVALPAIASMRTAKAIGVLYEAWESKDVYFASGVPTEALAAILRTWFADREDRQGPAWDRAREWLDDAYSRFVNERGTRFEQGPTGGRTYSNMGSDIAISDSLLRLALDWGPSVRLVDQVEAETREDQTVSMMSSPTVRLRWQVLGRFRPEQLLDIGDRYLSQPVSDSNKPGLVAALLEVADPAWQVRVRELAMAVADDVKSEVRRRIALEVARADPPWLGEIVVNDTTAPLLRDVALFSQEATANAIVQRLLAVDASSVRRRGHEAVSGRKRRAAAAEAWDLFVRETDPFRRLWWNCSFISLADEQALTLTETVRGSGIDLQRRFAVEDMRKEVAKRIEKEAREDDSRKGTRPWLWG